MSVLIKHMSSQDPYSVLGIDKNASQEEVRRAYRVKSLQHHPDRNPNNPNATAEFQKISQAYEQIDTPEKRAGMGRNGNARHPPNGPINAEDLLSSFMQQTGMQFGHGGPQPGMPQFFFSQAMQRPAPIMQTIHIDLHRAYSGCMVPLTISKWTLQGDTKVTETETVYVDVPAGIDSNEVIVLRGKGNVIAQDNVGDIKVFVKVTNETDFQRTGLDLVYKRHITLKEALCGFSIEMTHLNGKAFRINNTEGNVMSPGKQRVVAGLGMKRGEKTGNLIVEFQIDFPEKLSKEAMTALVGILP
jgi:DnaJ-class molecular chaperone